MSEKEKILGFEIYQTFFIDDIRKYFLDFFKLLEQQKIIQLSLVISSDDFRILNVPFELLSDSLDKEFFLLRKDTFSISRTRLEKIDNYEISAVKPIKPPLRILFVASLPDDIPDEKKYLELEKEQEKIIDIIGDIVRSKLIDIDFLEIVCLSEIEKSISEKEYQIIHISGHGYHMNGEGILELENENGYLEKVTGQQLAEVLSKYECVRLVILNSCETGRAEEYGIAGALILKGIPLVLAMRYPITDKVAQMFSTCLYNEICNGRPLGKAVFRARSLIKKYACDKIKDERTKEKIYFGEWYSPVLYSNNEINFCIDCNQDKNIVEESNSIKNI